VRNCRCLRPRARAGDRSLPRPCSRWKVRADGATRR
jgi:hypothetical protein